MGRYPDGASEFYRLRTPTAGTTNSAIRADDIVINEIMYAPISEESDDEYIELYNKGTNSINIGGWKFTAGIDYRFPTNTIIAPNGYIVGRQERFAPAPELSATEFGTRLEISAASYLAMANGSRSPSRT
jgi:hypothetical protein